MDKIKTDSGIPIFVSVGRVYTQEQVESVETILRGLHASGLEPMRLPPDQWNPRDPIEPILDLMKNCYGVIVISFARYLFLNGYEWPHSTSEVAISARELPTTWLQIEAALARARELPLLALVERNTQAEGMLNPKHAALNAAYYSLAACRDRLPAEVAAAIVEFASRVSTYRGRQQP